MTLQLEQVFLTRSKMGVISRSSELVMKMLTFELSLL